MTTNQNVIYWPSTYTSIANSYFPITTTLTTPTFTFTTAPLTATINTVPQNEAGATFTIKAQPAIQTRPCTCALCDPASKLSKLNNNEPRITFSYKDEKLDLGLSKDWVGREGIFDYAKNLLMEQMNSGGYLTEHAWGCCVRRAEHDLKEAAKGIMVLSAWLSKSVTQSDYINDELEYFRNKLRKALGLNHPLI